MKKILFVLHPKSRPENWARSGDTNLAMRIVQNLDPNKYQVDVACDYSNPELSVYDLRSQYGMALNEIVDLSQFIEKRTYLKYSMEYLASIAECYDMIHFHNSRIGAIKYMTNLFSEEQKKIHTMHTAPQLSATFGYHYGDHFVEFSTNPNNRLVAVSESHKDVVLSILGKSQEEMPSLTYITNGVEDMMFNQPNMYDISIISRPDPAKNTLKSLEVALAMTDGPIAYVGDVFQGTTTTGAGDEYYDSIVKLINDNTNITWYRHLTNSAVRKLLASSKCTVAFSYGDTFGLTAAEAIMQGTVAVVPAGAIGLQDVVSDGVSGYIYNGGRKQWKTRYKELKELFDTKIGPQVLDRSSVRSDGLSRLTIDRMVREYIDMYEELGGM